MQTPFTFIDLHTHSTASDGKLSPQNLIREAAGKGISVLALTDHDVIDGVPEASFEAKKQGIAFIPGVELAVDWRNLPGFNEGGEFHLLGLGLWRPSDDFLAEMKKLKEFRLERNLQILEKMKEAGWNVNYDDLCEIAGNEFIGRPHIAEYMVRLKIVRNMEQAFSRYLAKGRDLFVPKYACEFSCAVRILKESGALAVLAHPSSLFISWGVLPSLFERLKELGLDGVEAWHPGATRHTCKRLEALSQSTGLFVTAGSDYHGEDRRGRRLGRTAGGEKIPASILEAIPSLRDAALAVARDV
ncbi:MAG: PHP domain-containing protein [Spirochaetaceae bacterium]|jgi:predicted metal-dependent phosphoesterase TrpH|nr:PHP domain-containing protein [Spirochaetaceae bacterium]